MENPVNFEGLLNQAAAVFEKSSGSSAILSDPVVLKESHRSQVLRCRVESAGTGISSLILKKVKQEPERGFSDWASLAFLSGLLGAERVVPRFHGGDPAELFFLMEDRGEGRSLEAILSAGDPDELRASLRDLAIQMARLHNASAGREDEFEEIRSSLPHADSLGREKEAAGWLRGGEKIFRWFEAIGCQATDDLEECFKFIADFYMEASGFLAFTHGDPAPSNNHFGKGSPRLLDFEYGGFRHALYDITAWNVLCPLPEDLVAEMKLFFQAELVRGFPAAEDQTRFDKAWACLCAYRAWAILTWIPTDVINVNRPWAGNWTMREAVFVALSRMKESCGLIPELDASHAAAGILLDGMSKRWPGFGNAEALLPRWCGREPGFST